MKFSLLFPIVSCPLLIAALPEGSEYRELKHLTQQCANFELSCCSNFRNSAEGTQVFDTSGTGTNIIGNSVAVLGDAITGPLQQLIPISILSGCSPIIGMEIRDNAILYPISATYNALGNAQIECTNYIACCVPEGRREDGLTNVFTPILPIILKLLLTKGLG